MATKEGGKKGLAIVFKRRRGNRKGRVAWGVECAKMGAINKNKNGDGEGREKEGWGKRKRGNGLKSGERPGELELFCISVCLVL